VRITATRTSCLALAFTFVLQVNPAFGSPNYKCKKPACDINAIGHRKLFNGPSVGNWYSTEKEKQFGEKYATAVEQRVDIVKDAGINAYVDQVAQRVARNSDADMPVTVRVIRQNNVGAFTLFGGHLYLTTGLLLKLQGEGELASLLARGIAHTALHSVARLQTRATLQRVASIPVVEIDGWPNANAAHDMTSTFGLVKFQRDFELEADYFGIQYVYKSGYDTDCFLSAVQKGWEPDPSTSLSRAFSPFPPIADRAKMLRQEIDDILPMLPGTVVSTSEFDEFIGHLRQIAPQEPVPGKDTQPKLVRHDLPN
jgi:predicted Zn-dependent protease